MPEFDEIRSAPTRAAGDVEVCDEKEKSESRRAMLASEVSDDETRSSPTQAACDMEIGDEEKEKSESPSDLESLRSCGSEFEYTLTEEEEEETPVRENEFEGFSRAKKVHHCLKPIYAGVKRFADHSTKGRALFHALISAASIAGLLFDKRWAPSLHRTLRDQKHPIGSRFFDNKEGLRHRRDNRKFRHHRDSKYRTRYETDGKFHPYAGPFFKSHGLLSIYLESKREAMTIGLVRDKLLKGFLKNGKGRALRMIRNLAKSIEVADSVKIKVVSWPHDVDCQMIGAQVGAELENDYLQIREDTKKGIHVENLTEVDATSARDVIQQLVQVSNEQEAAHLFGVLDGLRSRYHWIGRFVPPCGVACVLPYLSNGGEAPAEYKKHWFFRRLELPGITLKSKTQLALYFTLMYKRLLWTTFSTLASFVGQGLPTVPRRWRCIKKLFHRINKNTVARDAPILNEYAAFQNWFMTTDLLSLKNQGGPQARQQKFLEKFFEKIEEQQTSDLHGKEKEEDNNGNPLGGSIRKQVEVEIQTVENETEFPTFRLLMPTQKGGISVNDIQNEDQTNERMKTQDGSVNLGMEKQDSSVKLGMEKQDSSMDLGFEKKDDSVELEMKNHGENVELGVEKKNGSVNVEPEEQQRSLDMGMKKHEGSLEPNEKLFDMMSDLEYTKTQYDTIELKIGRDNINKIVTDALHEIEAKELSEFFCNYAIESSKEDLLSLVKGLIWDEIISKRRLLEEGSSKADGANPPYQIYATSIMLAKYLGAEEGGAVWARAPGDCPVKRCETGDCILSAKRCPTGDAAVAIPFLLVIL
ncbi:unnamed protein product [Cuscuta campestris]|uniref:Uncharacterized protein n=1 Tax=Cuscuta campestris TaxID=132261 RepID=A0A484LBU1_9ASTE|nr:unnamed protein product [Cuscuta campestris]